MVEGQGAARQQESPEQPQEPEQPPGQGRRHEAVELEYRPVVADFRSALKARAGVSKAGRRRYWATGAMTVAAVLQGTKALTGHGGSLFLAIWLAVLVPVLLLSPRLIARQFQRLGERQGTFRVTVSDAGVTVITDNSTTALNWVAQPRYRETADVFVMISPDNNASSFTVLPKRAVRAPEDVDRLRAILDRNLTRV
ncbi:YcxB family protein [Streptomyces sp. NPDC005281]|uniref:YcxB family protein n=1 Tax=Streptomyces sp. NPDC005281 TaxID=3155712 RepID=UPI0033AEC866